MRSTRPHLHSHSSQHDKPCCGSFKDCRSGVTQIQYKETGLAKSGISEVLAGKKPFSKAMIGTLAADSRVPTSVLTANIGVKK